MNIQPTHFIGKFLYALIGDDPLINGRSVCRYQDQRGIWILVSAPTSELRPIAEKYKAGCKVWVWSANIPTMIFERIFVEMKGSSISTTTQHPSTWINGKAEIVYQNVFSNFTFTEPKAKE